MIIRISSLYLRYIKGNREDKQEISMKNNYDKRNFQNRYRSNSGDRQTAYIERGQYGQNYRGRPHYINNYRDDFRRGNFRDMQRNSLNTKIGGQVRYIKEKEAICLMSDQARHTYEMVESEGVMNVDAIKQEIETDKLEDDDNLGGENEINPYHEIITNKVEKDNMIILQMEQWSVLSNVVNYVQYDRHPKIFYDVDIKTIDQKSHKKLYGKEEKR